jgi:hypothetical protein
MRHEGDASCPEVEDDSVAFEDMLSTVRARKRAGTGEGCESILLSLETADRSETEMVEGDGVEGGRRIRYAVSAGGEAFNDACGGSGFITVTPVALGDNGDAIIGAGIV